MSSFEWATPTGGTEYVDEEWIEEVAPDGNDAHDVGFTIGDGTVIYGQPQELVELFTKAIAQLRRTHPERTSGAVIEAIDVRDPDSNTEPTFFVDGVEVDVQTHSIDAGAGWTSSEWNQHVEEMLASASPAVRAELKRTLENVPGQEYIR